MKTYRSWTAEDEPYYLVNGMMFLATEVITREPTSRPSGILDKDGKPIMIHESMDRIGFIRRFD